MTISFSIYAMQVLWMQLDKNSVLIIDNSRFLNLFKNFNYKALIYLVFALTTLHNFIQNYQSEKIVYFEKKENKTQSTLFHKLDSLQENFFIISTEKNQKRNRIANQIREKYSDILSRQIENKLLILFLWLNLYILFYQLLDL